MKKVNVNIIEWNSINLTVKFLLCLVMLYTTSYFTQEYEKS